jgi:hypothetical protein
MTNPPLAAPEMGFDALDACSGVADNSVVSRTFSLISASEENEFVSVGTILPDGPDHRGHEPLLASRKRHKIQ